MRIDLNNLLSGVETKLDINYILDLSNLIQKLFLMVNGAPAPIFAFGKRRLVNSQVKQSA